MEQRVQRWIVREQKKVEALAATIGHELELSNKERDSVDTILQKESDGQGKLL